jgi:glycerate kinase
MNKLTKIEKFFNNVTLTADDNLFVGIDVHKKSYHVALYLNNAPAMDFVMPAEKEQLSQKLKTASGALRQVVYETGSNGYGLAKGAAEVFGHQKDADLQTVKRLDYTLRHLSELVKTILQIDVSTIPGGGATGGFGAGAVAFLNAQFVSGIQTIIDVSNLKKDLQTADWILTGEGGFDSQSLRAAALSG